MTEWQATKLLILDVTDLLLVINCIDYSLISSCGYNWQFYLFNLVLRSNMKSTKQSDNTLQLLNMKHFYF